MAWAAGRGCGRAGPAGLRKPTPPCRLAALPPRLGIAGSWSAPPGPASPAPPRPCARSWPRRRGAPPATPEPEPERRSIQAGTRAGAGARAGTQAEADTAAHGGARQPSRVRGVRPGAVLGRPEEGVLAPSRRFAAAPRLHTHLGALSDRRADARSQAEPQRARNAIPADPDSRPPDPRQPRLPLSTPLGLGEGGVSPILVDSSPRRASTPRQGLKTVSPAGRCRRFGRSLNNLPKKGKTRHFRLGWKRRGGLGFVELEARTYPPPSSQEV